MPHIHTAADDIRREKRAKMKQRSFSAYLRRKICSQTAYLVRLSNRLIEMGDQYHQLASLPTCVEHRVRLDAMQLDLQRLLVKCNDTRDILRMHQRQLETRIEMLRVLVRAIHRDPTAYRPHVRRATEREFHRFAAV